MDIVFEAIAFINLGGKMAIRLVHALPNSWLPTPGNNLVVSGISAADLALKCQGKEIISHVRYEDHAARISKELGISLAASGVNAPTPFECNDLLVVASLSPGSSQINYVMVWDATAVLREAGVMV